MIPIRTAKEGQKKESAKSLRDQIPALTPHPNTLSSRAELIAQLGVEHIFWLTAELELEVRQIPCGQVVFVPGRKDGIGTSWPQYAQNPLTSSLSASMQLSLVPATVLCSLRPVAPVAQVPVSKLPQFNAKPVVARNPSRYLPTRIQKSLLSPFPDKTRSV